MKCSKTFRKIEKYQKEVIVKSIFFNKSIFELSNFNFNIFKNITYKYIDEIQNKLIRPLRFDSKKLNNILGLR